MAATGTRLAEIKDALRDLLAARDGLAGVPVRYGPPLNADDVTDTSGDLRAIWFGDNASSDIVIPYMMPGAKVTHEQVRLEVVVQAVVRDDDGSRDGQKAADDAAEALLAEVLSELAEDPSLGLSAPMAAMADRYDYTQLPRAANAWGARFTLAVTTNPAGIAAPS